MRCEAVETIEETIQEGAPRALVCVGCGCTDDRACPGGCDWVSHEPPICSACDEEPARPQSFDQERCPASPLNGPHDKLWVDGNSGYCVRCRSGFMT